MYKKPAGMVGVQQNHRNVNVVRGFGLRALTVSRG